MNRFLKFFTVLVVTLSAWMLFIFPAEASADSEWQRYEDLVFQSPADAVGELTTLLDERQHDAVSFARFSALLADAYSGVRNWQEAERVARLGLSRLPDTPSEARAELLSVLAFTLLSRSQYDEARELYGAAIAYAERADSAGIGAKAHMGMADLLTTLEQNEGALEHIRMAHEFARRSHNRRLLAAVTNEMATIYSYMDRNATAIKYYGEAYQLALESGDPVEAAVCLYNLASAYQADEQYQNAIANFELSYAASQKAGLQEDMAYAQMGLANGWLALQRYSKAERAFLKAERMIDDTADPGFVVQLYVTAVEIDLAQHKDQQAAQHLQILLAALQNHPDLQKTWMSQKVQRLQAKVLAARGEYTEAYIKLDEHVAQLAAFYREQQRSREARLRVAFDVDRQALENAMLEQETVRRQQALQQSLAAQQRWFIWSAVLGLMSLALAISLYWQWQGQRKLRLISCTDPLTKLYNRRFMRDSISRRMSPKGMRLPGSFSVVEFELCGFAALIERYDHSVAEDLLVQIAGAVKGMLRGQDLLGRLGGERFLLVLADTNDRYAWRACERLRQIIGQVLAIHPEYALLISCRFGVATYIGDDRSVDALLQRAHQALLKDSVNHKEVADAVDGEPVTAAIVSS